jgi:hypothetical protein
MVFAAPPANTECTATCYCTDADGMTGRPQVAAVMQVQNLQKHFALGTCAQTGTSTDWT